jgi:hypothetical protein
MVIIMPVFEMVWKVNRYMKFSLKCCLGCPDCSPMYRPSPVNLLTIRNICPEASAGAAKGAAQSDLCSAYNLLRVFEIEMISFTFF